MHRIQASLHGTGGAESGLRQVLDNVHALCFAPLARRGGRGLGHEAARAGDIELVKVWLDAATRIDKLKGGHDWLKDSYVGLKFAWTDARSATAVDVLSTGDAQWPLSYAVKGGWPLVTSLFLRHGADPHARARLGGKTLLMMASEAGKSACVQILLEEGVDVNAVTDDDDRSSAASLAQGGGKLDCLFMLQEYEAEVRHTLPVDYG
eukprot:SAG11_NODE_2561_length_3220_cov_1.882730_1_plen_206_part_10